MLDGLFGKTVELQSGETVVVDEAYIRESILQPGGQGHRRLPADHADVPGLVTEEQLLELIEYIKSLEASAAARCSTSDSA